eukprot:TRINITY_DN2952_c0_g1_i2.p1 TRINITY_DN2952_c0_g1~~TRINITY_DN2952_c0_g1_i2.p1  ORF type:complete len:439 (-),score=58.84 TRINITY_DN2952_c0_g1_i2:270-1586(-)
MMDERESGYRILKQVHNCGEEEELVSSAELVVERPGLEANIVGFCLEEGIVHNCVESDDILAVGSAGTQAKSNYVHGERGTDAENKGVFSEAEEDSHTDVFVQDAKMGEDLPLKDSGLDVEVEDVSDGEHDCISFLENFDSPSTSGKQPSSVKQRKRYPCEECGETFVKPSNLKQHMLCHATEKMFCCPISGCDSKYKRPDHLKRHMVTHSGQLFFCTWEGCSASFTLVSNLKRHTKLHQVKGDYLQRCGKRVKPEDMKPYVCAEPDCGYGFEFESQLHRHEKTTHGIKSILYECSDPGCGESFPQFSAMQQHVGLSHGLFVCDICGLSVPTRKESKHRKSHDEEHERLPCPVPGCQHRFTRRSNLNTHMKAVHEMLKPFVCSFAGCGKSFAYKAVRDRHEKTGAHCPTTVRMGPHFRLSAAAKLCFPSLPLVCSGRF